MKVGSPPEIDLYFSQYFQVDMLTRYETWINYGDMVARFQQLPDAVPNTEQRANINLASAPNNSGYRRSPSMPKTGSYPEEFLREITDVFNGADDDAAEAVAEAMGLKGTATCRASFARAEKLDSSLKGRGDLRRRPGP